MSNKTMFNIPKNTNSGIYMLYNLNNHKVYIGETHNFKARARQHQSNLKINKHPNKSLQEDYNIGNEFVFVVLEDMGSSCDDKELIIREKLYISAFYDKYVKLYNCEIREDVKEYLYSYFVTPLMWDVQRDLQKKFHSPICTLCNCRSDTLKAKFENINA